MRDDHDYVQDLANCMPFGHGITVVEDSNLWNLLLGLAYTYSRIQDRLDGRLDKDLNPATSVDFLEEWESIIKPHGNCTEVLPTISERQQALQRKLSDTSPASLDQLKQIGLDLGYSDIQVSEYLQKSYVNSVPNIEHAGVNWISVYRINTTSIPAKDEILKCTIMDALKAWETAIFELL